MKAIKSVKQAFEDQNVIITKIIQGNSKNVRIDAKTRFNVSDADNFFSEWVSIAYANKLSLERFGKKVNELKSFNY